MKSAPFLLAGAVFGSNVLLAAAPAVAKVRVVPFGQTSNWRVRAVYGESGMFDHCSANTRYQSGTRVSIIVYRSGGWRLWFAHSAWPDRGNAKFPATVSVDGRVVLSQDGFFKGKNAYVNLGREVSRVKALMRGRAMSITTPAGTSRFSLNGTNQATRLVARCWKAHYQTNPGAGAFGSANNNATGGAFGDGGGTKLRDNELSRANTLEIAANYLSRAAQPYSILPADKAPLKHFPVNWKLQDGSIGGMRVFKNTNVAVEKLLATLLSGQAKHCKGRNASQREPAKSVKGRQIIHARGVCETSKGVVLNITYKVAELGRQMVMMIMEVRSAGGSKAGSGAKKVLPGAGVAGSPKPDEI